MTALRAGAWGFVRTPRDAEALALQLQAYVQAKRSVDHAFAEGLIDRAPKWGDERDPPEMWIRRQDEYEDAGARADA